MSKRNRRSIVSETRLMALQMLLLNWHRAIAQKARQHCALSATVSAPHRHVTLGKIQQLLFRSLLRHRDFRGVSWRRNSPSLWVEFLQKNQFCADPRLRSRVLMAEWLQESGVCLSVVSFVCPWRKHGVHTLPATTNSVCQFMSVCLRLSL